MRRLLLILSAVLVLSSCSASIHEVFNEDAVIAPQTTPNDLSGTEYTLFLENDNVEFWVNENTTEFKLVNKSDAGEWYSTNKSHESDTEQRALFELSYLDSNGTISTMNAMSHSVKNGQYRIERLNDHSLAVHYSVGEFTEQIIVPSALSEERFAQIMDSIDDEFQQMKLLNYYLLVDINNVENEADKKAYLSGCPALADQPFYILTNRAKDSPLVKNEVAALFASLGYTKEQYEKDSEYFDSNPTERQEAGFNLKLVYTLEADGISVEIPNDSIHMKSDYPLTNIKLLKYFGSPQQEEKGYFLLPDGSGSLMNFYNGKGSGHDYSVTVYGSGYALAQNEKTSDYDNASLPVFGIKSNNSAVLVQIEEGASIADIHAYPGDDLLVPYANASFRIRETYVSKLATGKKETFLITQKQRYSGNIKLRYSLLSGADADYNGMARLYRRQLFGDQPPVKGGTPAVTTEYVGFIQKQTQMLGIPYSEAVVMTKFDEVQACTEQLIQGGISNFKIKLSGWFNGGYNHRYINKISVEKRLGGEKGLIELAKYCADNQIAFYPDADIQYTGSTGWLDGFSKTKDVISLINQAIGTTYAFDPATFTRNKTMGNVRYIHNINAQKRALSAMETAYRRLGFNGVSLRNIGIDINADFNQDNHIDREEAAAEIVKALQSLRDKEFSVITRGSNSFVLPYIDGAINVPLTSNRYDNTDESIPFLMMVLSGYVEFSGSAVNLSGDIGGDILNAATTGAGIYCIFTANNFDAATGGADMDLYSSDFTYWKEIMTDMVGQYQKSFENIAGQRIQAYEILQNQVYKTTFEDGSGVIVNYSNTEVIVDGLEIASKSYKVLEA